MGVREQRQTNLAQVSPGSTSAWSWATDFISEPRFPRPCNAFACTHLAPAWKAHPQRRATRACSLVPTAGARGPYRRRAAEAEQLTGEQTARLEMQVLISRALGLF